LRGNPLEEFLSCFLIGTGPWFDEDDAGVWLRPLGIESLYADGHCDPVDAPVSFNLTRRRERWLMVDFPPCFFFHMCQGAMLAMLNFIEG
jgi:hypothetical protein